MAHLHVNESTSSTTTQVAAATYLDNQNDLNVLSNVGNGIRCQIFDDSDCSNSATVEAEPFGTNSGLIGTVLGHAVAWSSWGKSGCKQKCCFPIDQELYHPYGVTHLDANKSTSSTTTQVAAANCLDDQNELNILSNVGDGIRCQIFDNSDCSNSSTVEEELLCTNSGLIGTVLGHAVARSSWGKSGCKQ